MAVQGRAPRFGPLRVRQIIGDRVTLLVERALPQEITRDSLDEGIVHLKTMREAMRDDKARREGRTLPLSRLKQVKATLSF